MTEAIIQVLGGLVAVVLGGLGGVTFAIVGTRDTRMALLLGRPLWRALSSYVVAGLFSAIFLAGAIVFVQALRSVFPWE